MVGFPEPGWSRTTGMTVALSALSRPGKAASDMTSWAASTRRSVPHLSLKRLRNSGQ
jgi:hypothetical protein